jgi:hypothetical protein
MTLTVDRIEELQSLYADRYEEVLAYQQEVDDFHNRVGLYADVTDEDYEDYEEGVAPTVRPSAFWGAHIPFSEQVTLALRVGYYEGLLTNQYDSYRFNVSSYYRLGQILGSMARRGEIPHDSWKAIVWAVDDLTGFMKSLPLGVQTYNIAKDIAASINGEGEFDASKHYYEAN